jgi:hypothetical protein
MDLEKGELATRGTRRFTELAFQQRLWKHMVNAVVSNLDLDADPEEIHAVAGLCTLTKFRNAFQELDREAEIHLSDPDYPADKKADIQRNRMRKRLLNQYVDICAAFIGQRYAKLLFDGDVAGRKKLEKLINSIEIRFAITPGRPTLRPVLKWHFFVALTALESLSKSVVPTRKQIIEGAIQTRAAFELQLGFADPRTRDSRIMKLHFDEPENWERIIRDLDLVGLPLKAHRF